MSLFAINTSTAITRINPPLRAQGADFSASTVSQTETADTVSLSACATGTGSLRDMLSLDTLLGFETETPGVVTLEELESHGRQSLDDFNRNVTSLLAQAGVDVNTPMELTVGSDGNIRVTNDHPDREAIEEFFASNPDLANQYRGIDNMLTLAAEGREAAAFQEAYGSNPTAAVARFRYLFNTKLSSSITISAQGADIAFDRIYSANG